jgi:KDEL-tailed cysteine endopeptidase
MRKEGVFAVRREEAYRRSVFDANDAVIVAHNAGNHTWTMGHNSFSDLTPAEFAARYIGGWAPRAPDYASRPSTDDVSSNDDDSSMGPRDDDGNGKGTLPPNVDWVSRGAVTPVKDQGEVCGSCWAFSSTGAVEALTFLTQGKLISLSEQELIDCSSAQGTNGCNGGYPADAFKYITYYGICSESAYPYTGVQGTCRSSCTAQIYLSSSLSVPKDSDAQMMAAVAKQPVSVIIHAGNNFQLYDTGVLPGSQCKNAPLNHAVLLVGYGTPSSGMKYYKIKNSWGTSWGLGGYLLLERGGDINDGSGTCGILKMGVVPRP